MLTTQRPSVRFGGTQEWVFQEDDMYIPYRAVTKEVTKQVDGPNDYSLFKGKFISDYILGKFRTLEQLDKCFDAPVINLYIDEISVDILAMIEKIRKGETCALYYMNYRVDHTHLEHMVVLSALCNILVLSKVLTRIKDDIEGQ